MKAIRYIIFIPIIYLIIELVFTLLSQSFFGLMSLSKSSIITFLLLFGGAAVVIFYFLPGVIIWISSKISPSKKFAFYSILTISAFSAIIRIYRYWTVVPDINEVGIPLILLVMLTCLTIGFAISFSIGGGISIEVFEEESNSTFILSTVMLIGTIIFYVGIFLAFCILSIKICYINPEKTYSWYSGIWHGIFIIPHWVVSWFTDDIYCKAPKASIAYIIWWWILLVSAVTSIISPARR